MKSKETEYEKILNILKKSKPVLSNTGDLEENVINMILHRQRTKNRSFNILDIIFGWVYVRWVRTVLVTASVILILAFIYQQTIILKRINNLDSRAMYIENQVVTEEGGGGDRTLFYKLSGRILPSKGVTISEKQLDKIINSYNELEEKYKDLIKLIDENPELKNYVEKKLSEKNKKKLNL